ncbi:glycoside hydrolase domain-containing protein [Planctomycetota bacterium]
MKSVIVSIFGCFVMLSMAVPASGADQTVHDIFVNGKLAPGVKLQGGEVQGNEIRTISLGKEKWAIPMFYVRGLNIDISKVNLAQVHLRIFAAGGHSEKPSYSDIQIFSSKKVNQIHIKQFPFRSWQKNKPDYMMKSMEHIGKDYAKFPHGKAFGAITGFGIKTSGGYAMRLTKIQILIDKDMKDKYPDDPKPSPDWKGGEITDVFAIPISERMFQNQKDSPLKAENTVWKDGGIQISGARNETVAFQVIMQTAGDKDGINDVNVKFDGLQKGEVRIDNSGVKNPKDPYDYIGRHIQLYCTRYVKHYFDRGDKTERAAGTIGKWIPEIQIPFEAKWGGTPFSIFPGKTQAVWVDVYIPKDAAAGVYAGQVEVQVGGTAVKSLPVTLKVHDFTLPMKPSVVGAFLGSVPSKHGAKTDEEKYEMAKTYRQFYRRHHTELFSGFGSGTTAAQLADPKTWHIRSGKIYTAEEGYEGPGEGVPTTFLFIKMYGGGLKPFGGPGLSGTESDWHKGLLPYLEAKRKYAPKATLSYYVWDEPNHAFKGGTAGFTKWFNQYAGPFVDSFNKKYDADIKLYSSISAGDERNMPLMDIYTARTRERALEIEKRGDICARWNGPQGLGHFASALRVVGWKAYYGKSYFWWMWHANAFSHSFDVYRDTVNFRNQYGESQAGCGMFVYPGTDVVLPKRNPGLKGPVPGTRFLNWRQGFIDAEYLSLAEKKDPAKTLSIAQDMVKGTNINSGLPGEKTSAGYPTNAARYAAAREMLVEIILGE